MVDTDFRALCAELVVIEDAMSGGSVQLSSQGQALDGYAGLAAFRYIAARARIALALALAQPEPVAPTDEEIMEVFWEHQNGLEELWADDWPAAARAVLARWGTPANTTSDHP